VQVWIGTHDYKEVEKVQHRILKDYADDFGKYASPDTATKIKLNMMPTPELPLEENLM